MTVLPFKILHNFELGLLVIARNAYLHLRPFCVSFPDNVMHVIPARSTHMNLCM